MIEFSDIAAYAGASGLGGGFVSFLFRGLLAEVKTLRARSERAEKKLAELQDNDIANVKTELIELKKRCNAETVAADQKNLLGWMKKVDLKLDAVQSSTDTMKGTIEGQAKWLSNINDAVQDHVTNYSIHSPKN